MDWKSTIKRKLAHNRSEMHATGGGAFNQYVLSANETEVAQITGLFSIVKGVAENASASGVRQSLTSTCNQTAVTRDAQINANKNEVTATNITAMETSLLDISNAEYLDDDPIAIEEEIKATPSCSRKINNAEKPLNVNNLMESEIEAFNNIATKIDKTNNILQDICNVLKQATEENRKHNDQMQLLIKKLTEKQN